jgi:hypothetical protein
MQLTIDFPGPSKSSSTAVIWGLWAQKAV